MHNMTSWKFTILLSFVILHCNFKMRKLYELRDEPVPVVKLCQLYVCIFLPNKYTNLNILDTHPECLTSVANCLCLINLRVIYKQVFLLAYQLSLKVVKITFWKQKLSLALIFTFQVKYNVYKFRIKFRVKFLEFISALLQFRQKRVPGSWIDWKKTNER